MKRILLIYVLLISYALPVYSQIAKADPPPGKMELLPGYHHKTGRGIDTAVGHIWKDGGITISYDIGGLAGIYVLPNQKDQNGWYREQKINNQTVRIVLTNERQLRVTFVEATANFVAVVPKDEDLADALLMILTYRSR
jgi:hypothetical protein